LNAEYGSTAVTARSDIESQLRIQIKADRLQSIRPDDSDDEPETVPDSLDPVILEPELREKCLKFLGSPVSIPAHMILTFG
jgi:hypothetical protein